MITHQAIKKSIRSYLILCGFLVLASTVQAASIAPPDAQESYDYTLAHHADQVSPIEDKAYLDIEEIPQELTIIMQVAASKDNKDVPQLLAVVAEDVQNRQYYKYLFASNGLLASSQAQQKAHNLNYHLVKAPAGPVIWQVLSFLGPQSKLEVEQCILPQKAPLCLKCFNMALHLFDKKLLVDKKGCQGTPFPTTSAPASAIACFYSDRFTDQQRRLVISQVGEQAFPVPKKLIILPPTHDNDHHKLTSQPLTQPLPPDQLLIPANGQCLYTTVIMGYLLPVRQEEAELDARVDQLFGMQPADYINELHQTLENPTHYLTYLHSDAFSSLVTAFMVRMKIKKGTWGGPAEIQTIAIKLKVNIQTYYPDPSNLTNLVQSDLTKPAQATTCILHIVRDKVHPAEVLTQVEKKSAKANPHYQHYRLKYTLPPSRSAPAISAPLSPNNVRHKPTIPSARSSSKLISAPFSKQNNHSKDGSYTISNPLVLLIGVVEYHQTAAQKEKNIDTNLYAVKEDMQVLYDLFKRKCGYEVVSTFFDKGGHIFPRHQENEKEMDGKWLYKSKLITWIDQQVSHLQQHGKKYDAVILIFSGHGGRTRDGREYIVTSDGGLYLWQHIESTFASDLALHDDFGHKPKLFLKLACRNSSTSVITEDSIPVDKTNVFRCYATAEGKFSWTDATKELINALFDFFQEAIQHGYALSWIENRLKEVMKRHPRQWDAPETGGGLITDKIFFQKKEKGKFILPATNNLPKLPHEVCHIMSREEEIKIIAYDFLDGQTQQALIAAGGLGKSTLARLYARKYLAEGRYAHAWWFNAEDEATLAASIAAVSKAMGIEANDHLNMRKGMDKIEEKLQTCPEWLLIFDNAQDPSKLLINFLPKDTRRGHILITSRYDKKKIWSKNEIYPKPVAGITRLAAKKFLPGFHIPEGNEEATSLAYLLTSVEEKDKLLPLTLAQIGYYLKQEKKARSQDGRPTNTIYQDYLGLYKKKLESYNANDNPIAPSILITFTITAKKIKEKITQGKDTDLEEIWRILQMMSFLHPDGLDKAFFAHLRPSLKHKFIKSKVSPTITDTQADKAAKCLCDYGILMEEKGKYRIHRTVQEIMRTFIKKKKITAYVQDEALQLLETMQQQVHTISHLTIDELRFTMGVHCHTLMKHLTRDEIITEDKEKKYIRLLHLMSQIDRLTYLKDKSLYLPPQAIQGGDLHRQVLKFINTTHSDFRKKKKWFSNKPYTPLLLIQGEAGTGKSTYATSLVKELWQIYLKRKIWAHIPLFISLPEFCAEGVIPTNIIELALAKNGISESVITQIKVKSTKQPWVFIFDGYDEIHGKQNLFTHCNLAAWGTSYSKYIITCRTTYLAEASEDFKKHCFQDNNRHPAEEFKIAPYAKDQIEGYVDKFAISSYNLYGEKSPYQLDKKDIWDRQRYQRELSKLPQLKAWMTTPFLLVVGMQALPRIVAVQRGANIPLSPTTTIYNAFVEEWLHREANKPQHKIDKATLRTFCENLGYILWKKKISTLKKADKTMTSFFENTYALQSAPLRYLGHNRYMFIHEDFRDFFAASFIFRNIAKNRLTPNLPNFSPTIKDFFLHLRDALWHYLCPGQQVPSIAARNSVQILYWTGDQDFRKAHLSQLDLSGINLAKAKLPQDLSSINLRWANLSHTNLTNVKLPKDLSNTNLSGATLPKDLSNTNLSGATLPKDLSNTNLSGATLPKDISNINLKGANLTYVQLDSATLDSLTCDYQQCFQDQVKANKLSGGQWYLDNLPKDLKSIAQVYPLLSQDSHKAELLQIASGLAYLPCWEGREFYIKIQYWSCKLLLLKKQLSSELGAQLVCSLDDVLEFEYDARKYCWQTDYPQHQVKEPKEAPHKDFEQYLKTFKAGLLEYNCHSKKSYGYNYYKREIEKNIQGLQKTYPKLTSPKLQKEAIDIAFRLSKIYQKQHLLLLFRYLFLQNRLIRLKISAGVGGENEVHYNHSRGVCPFCWSRGWTVEYSIVRSLLHV